ncbi:MAG: hypothetical protein E7644_08825 [Ruminococcaceae bacterium]|nr:hypothetical protein [Oscillospiraceae bacterium]
MDNAKKRRLINTVYLVVALAMLAGLILWCGLLIYEAYHPDGNSAGAVLAALAAVLLVIIFSIGCAVAEVVLLEAFILVRYLLTDPHKRPAFTVCNIVSASLSVVVPLLVLLSVVTGLDPEGNYALGTLLCWGIVWAHYRIVYCIVRGAVKRKNVSEE